MKTQCSVPADQAPPANLLLISVAHEPAPACMSQDNSIGPHFLSQSTGCPAAILHGQRVCTSLFAVKTGPCRGQSGWLPVSTQHPSESGPRSAPCCYFAE